MKPGPNVIGSRTAYFCVRQVITESVLFTHSWMHLSGSPTAHFKKTLLTRLVAAGSIYRVFFLHRWVHSNAVVPTSETFRIPKLGEPTTCSDSVLVTSVPDSRPVHITVSGTWADKDPTPRITCLAELSESPLIFMADSTPNFVVTGPSTWCSCWPTG